MAALFSRRAGAGEIAAELAASYPAAPDGLAASFDDRAPRAGDRLAAWVHDQVRRAAVLEVAHSEGLDRSPYPPDGAESLRVYLEPSLADEPVDAVPTEAWQRARDDAWTDHGEGLTEDRTGEWSEQLADRVDALVASWRTG